MEKRLFPRVNANLSAEILCEQGERFDVTVLDTSSSVLKIQCTAVERDIITPHGEWTRNGRPIEAEIRMQLPLTESNTHEINCRCTIAFSRRVAMDKFQVGMKYSRLDDASLAVLGEFIRLRMDEAV